MKRFPVSPTGNRPWIFIGGTDAEADTPILWPHEEKNQLIGKDPDAGKDWGQEEKGATEDEMVGWHHWLNGHELEQALEDGEEQGSLACCSPWDHKELDTTERPNKNKSLTWRVLTILVWKDASVRACWNHFFQVHLSIWGQSCFLHCSHTNSLVYLKRWPPLTCPLLLGTYQEEVAGFVSSGLRHLHLEEACLL